MTEECIELTSTCDRGPSTWESSRATNIVVAALPAFSPNGFLNLKRRSAEGLQGSEQSALKIKTPSMDQKIQNLSGGNQQKALISRWLLTLPDVLMIDERSPPARRASAPESVHRLMSLLMRSFGRDLMVSSELPEVLGMTTYIIVIRESGQSGTAPRQPGNHEHHGVPPAAERSPCPASRQSHRRFDFENLSGPTQNPVVPDRL